MNALKTILLAGYFYGSLPARLRRAAWRARCGAAPVMVVFYHRVADLHPNAWTISTCQFAAHVRWLRRHFDLVSLSEAQRRIGSGTNDRAAVSITFDDGYAENCAWALPLLAEQAVPVTYFVAAQHVLEGRPFPHDVAAGQPLRPNTVRELRQLAAAGVAIGAHTRTHADLGRIAEADRLHDEVVAARHELAEAVGCPIDYFAFPYGQHANLTPAAFALARRVGYAGVCSAYGGYNFPGDDPFHLQRIHGDPELLRLKNWLTVDPRKLNGVERFADAPAASDCRPPMEAAP